MLFSFPDGAKFSRGSPLSDFHQRERQKVARLLFRPTVRTALTQSLETGTNARASVGKW